MALLLPDVYLPKYGSIEIVILPDGSMFEDAYDEIFYTEFPLGTAIELPEHGDLIDRDEYIAMMESNCDKSTTLDSYIFHVCRGGVKTMPVIVPSNKEEKEATE